MKNYVIVLFFLVSALIYSQETKVVVLDMSTPDSKAFMIEDKSCLEEENNCWQPDKKLRISTNRLLGFRLKNVNPFKYNYELNSETLNLFSENISEFNESLNKINNAIKGKKDSVSNITKVDQKLSETINQNQNKLKTNKEMSEAIISKIDLLSESLSMEEEELQKLIIQSEQVQSSANDYIGFSTLENKVKKLTVNYDDLILNQQEAIEKIKKNIKNQENDLRENKYANKKLLAQNTNLKSLLIEIKKNIKETENKKLENIFEKAQLEILLHSNKKEELLNKIKGYLAEIKIEDYIDIIDFKLKRKSYLDKENSLNEFVNNLTRKMETELTDNYIEKYNKLLNDSFKQQDPEITTLIEKLYSTQLEYYLHPQEFDGKNIDAIQLIVKKTLKDNKSSEMESKPYEYNIWLKGGFKIDVSAGVFLSSLRNREYFVRTVSETVNGELKDFQVIYEKDLGSLEYGFGSVANIAFRNGHWVKPALSFGAMFTNDQKFQLIGGAGLILGKESRFVLHFGIIAGRTTSIQTSYKADGMTRYENLTSETIPTVEKLSIGKFFGVTYNLGKVKSQEEIRQ